MTKSEMVGRYVALTSWNKVRFLAIAAHNLTVMMRGDYDNPDLSFRVGRLHGANELEHHLSSQLLHHHNDEPDRYPDDVLIGILVDKATFYGLGGELRWALEEAMNRVQEKSI